MQKKRRRGEKKSLNKSGKEQKDSKKMSEEKVVENKNDLKEDNKRSDEIDEEYVDVEEESPAPCKICPVLVTEEHPALQCDMCDEWLHIECADVHPDLFREMNKKSKLLWFCESCASDYKMKKENGIQQTCDYKKKDNVNMFDCINGLKKQMKMMEDNMKNLQSSISTKIKLFEESFASTMEKQKEVFSEKVVNNIGQSWSTVVSKNIKKTIDNSQVITAINKNLESVRTNIDINKEKEEETKARKSKESNICIFNIPEGNDENVETNHKKDLVKLKQIFEGKILIKPDDVKTAYRIGSKKENAKYPRPFIMKFNSLSKRNEVLALRNLFVKKDNADVKEQGDRVFIQPDRTKKEIEEHQKLVKELKERRDSGEENIGIRNGKIIKFGNPFPDRPQFCWGA